MFDFVWTDGFMVGVSAGDLCLVVSTGVVTAEHLRLLAAALKYICVMVFFPMCCGEELLV